jgi:hypothetical protein
MVKSIFFAVKGVRASLPGSLKSIREERFETLRSDADAAVIKIGEFL